jgi:hypothetical protein
MKILYFIIYLLFASSIVTVAQHDSAIRKYSHHIFLGIGAQKNSFFSGSSIAFGYQYHIKQSFFSLHYQFSEEFLIFGGPAQNASEISALYNWYLLKNKIFSVGAGMAYTTILADTYNILGPPPQGSYNRPAQLKKNFLGFPMNLNIIVPSKRRFTGGVNLHANFNKYTTLFNGGLFMSLRVF